MLFTSYIKASEVTDFARTTYRRTAPMAVPHAEKELRIIYRSLNSAESLNLSSKSSQLNQAKHSKQAKIAKAEIFGSIAVAFVLVVIFGGVA
mgnify:CR=1 FL=1